MHDPPTSYLVFPGGGGGRIRTFEGVSRQIYSLLPLAAWVPLPEKTSRVFSWRPPGVSTGLARLLLRNCRPGNGLRERLMGWPADTHLYRSVAARNPLPGALACGSARSMAGDYPGPVVADFQGLLLRRHQPGQAAAIADVHDRV